MSVAATMILLAVVTGSPADVKGTWSGTLTLQQEDGSVREDTALLLLTQKDATITGTIGENAENQVPITSGTIEDNKIVLHATTPNGREHKVELTLEGDEMKGTVTSGERRAQIHVRRRKE